MAEILKKDDFKRVELLNLVTKKGGMRNLSLEQLILLDELLKKKDYSNEEKAEKSKKKLLKQINIEIYKRNDTAIWKI
ncbi:MAG: Uncharacterised protein [Candidatus Nitrosopelagicus brevis]|jgi:hypothetical protein|uniref:Uncharacterized protein n=1 Tax=Candidatus Nitrosopelagicus brevis TaxID=1410606 RepID=A0A2R6TAU7_9ARCH|nr:hypothetical protein [Candidatus Nitrosopelagicus brevis]MEE3213525.1 hypothetical protein [Thermoproteota archaeon]NMI83728.1 hypothetical protein [Candidatus Nitrosopelagicus brevis]PTL87789.1 hypothetical protein A7X95_00430 [Candidatus Nitrosopelagicus brevis]CAI8208401.1 MAG: Uncharacterised protein [Candidatus Nitrosopelagicus brevis]|tara:strand:- start:329 stop:562 length:234 start_codon:yes stop_codon:yes gene_type:complete